MFDFPQYVAPPPQGRTPDPLGLAATNMNLYRGVFPGMNNVVRDIRVYSAICWMVERVNVYLEKHGQASDKDATTKAFFTGVCKIQLMLIWGNGRRQWNIRSMPGVSRIWPEPGETKPLTYWDMPTPGAKKKQKNADAENEKAQAKLAELEELDRTGELNEEDFESSESTATLLNGAAYLPSITNGLRFLTRHREWPGVYTLTDHGRRLAAAYGELVRQSCPNTTWYEDPFALDMSPEILESFKPVLRVDEPTDAERVAFQGSFYPETLQRSDNEKADAVALARMAGITLALRALAAEQSNAAGSEVFTSVADIRHTMARGFTRAGIKVECDDVRKVHGDWRALQIRQYLKMALETLLRVCEHQIHHQSVMAHKHLGIKGVAELVGELAHELPLIAGLATREAAATLPAFTVGHAVSALLDARADSESMYGATDSRISIEKALDDLRKAAKFKLSKGDVKPAACQALFALLWCSAEATCLGNDEQVLSAAGDKLSLSTLKQLTDDYSDAPIAAFLAMIVERYVISLHFDVVRLRAQDDLSANRVAKDRYRIIVGEFGMERNMFGNAALANPFELSDLLLHVMYFMAQLGLVKDNGRKQFHLLDAGRERAAQSVPTSLQSLVATAAPDLSHVDDDLYAQDIAATAFQRMSAEFTPSVSYIPRRPYAD